MDWKEFKVGFAKGALAGFMLVGYVLFGLLCYMVWQGWAK